MIAHAVMRNESQEIELNIAFVFDFEGKMWGIKIPYSQFCQNTDKNIFFQSMFSLAGTASLTE
jgi:hypothetical protein